MKLTNKEAVMQAFDVQSEVGKQVSIDYHYATDDYPEYYSLWVHTNDKAYYFNTTNNMNTIEMLGDEKLWLSK